MLLMLPHFFPLSPPPTPLCLVPLALSPTSSGSRVQPTIPHLPHTRSTRSTKEETPTTTTYPPLAYSQPSHPSIVESKRNFFVFLFLAVFICLNLSLASCLCFYILTGIAQSPFFRNTLSSLIMAHVLEWGDFKTLPLFFWSKTKNLE